MSSQTLTSHATLKLPSPWSKESIKPALLASLKKLHPREQLKNPVMFVVYVGSMLTTILFLQALFGKGEASPGFILHITLWLWLTVLFANFAEAVAEGRAKAQAQALRSTRKDVPARKLSDGKRDGASSMVSATMLRSGDVVLVNTGEIIPGDGEV